VCGNEIEPVLFLGYLPPVNKMVKIGERPTEQTRYPAQLLFCPKCKLVQLGLVVDKEILFPPEYPYTSSTTKILRDNFKELYEECNKLFEIKPEDLIVDIGSNDGNLLSNFKDNCRVLGVTPEDIGKTAVVPTIIGYFNKDTVEDILTEHGKAKFITATNVFAHIDDIHEVMKCVLELLTEGGVFITESHYLLPLIEDIQYDTIYHEHLRYYSLQSLKYLFAMHGLEIFHAKRIPTHGGSIRVYAARKGHYPTMAMDERPVTKDRLIQFNEDVGMSKLFLMSLLCDIKNTGNIIYGISAPSRGSTLINYTGIDESILNCVVEVRGSYKIGNYMPGTLIPIVEESRLFEDQPDYALILSWHIAEEIIKNLQEKGYKGKFIIPLPSPVII
jgi:hypothetical protein